MKSIIGSSFVLLFALGAFVSGSDASAADFSAMWLGSNGNWTNGSLWSTAPNYPNNGAGGTYDASINTGFVTLNSNIILQRLTLSGGEINGAWSLTLNDGLSWTNGHLYTTGSINLATGSTSTISGSQVLFNGPTVNNSGTVTQTADVATGSNAQVTINNQSSGSWSIQQHYLSGGINPNAIVFNNSGNFSALDAAFGGTFNNSGTVTIQSNIGTEFSPGGGPGGTRTYHGLTLTGSGTLSGTFNVGDSAALILGPYSLSDPNYELTNGLTVNGTGTLASYDHFDIVGDVTINTNLAIESGGFSVSTGNILRLNGASAAYQGASCILSGGTVQTPNYPLLIQVNCQLFGNGTVDGDLQIIGAHLDATNPRPFRVTGNLSLDFYTSPQYRQPADVLFYLFGAQFGNASLSVGGSMHIDRATLYLSGTPGFLSQVNSSGGTYTLIQTGAGFDGAFFNVLNGQLIPAGSNTWFRANYGEGSLYGINNLVLSNGFVNSLNNGEFEVATNGRNVVGEVPGWNVIGNVAQVDDEGYISSDQCVSLSRAANSEGDAISQSFSTNVGQTYSLDFASGIFGIPDGGAVLRIRVQVFGNGTLLDDTQIPPVANTFDTLSVVFHHYHYTFTANSTTTTVQFSNIGLGNQAADELLDNVAVGPPLPTPPPTTLPLNNGDFEMSPTDSLGAVAGWTVSGNGKVIATEQGATSGANSAALDATGDSQGNILSQRFFTVPGGVYFLDFDSGIFGKRSGAPLQLHAQILGSTTRLDQTVTPPEASTWDSTRVVLQHYHFEFMADSTVTTLQFSDIGTGNSVADVELDTVSVVPRLTAAVNAFSGGSVAQISGKFLPNSPVKILRSFDLVNYTNLTNAQTDGNGVYSITTNIPPGHNAVFFKVTAP